ncbi:MAG: hypothetical protein M4579_005784 [Chaenotheca gracillima]|nr:MAG: hypothetical protein M4579_005784 [Chaenotheca gracillima]
MSDPDSVEREKRKREYNRLAQRDFRRRRKEHLKNLEQMQREQSSEQSEELEHLRAENEDLKQEIERLRAQVYESSSSSGYATTVPIPPSSRQSARSFSTSSPSSNYESNYQQVTGQVIPSVSQAGPASSSGMTLAPPPALDVLQMSPHSTPPNQPPVCIPGPYPTISQSIEHEPLLGMPSFDPRLVVMVPYDKAKAQDYLRSLFRPLLAPQSILNEPMDHLATLARLTESLPRPLRPTKAQLETPHHYGIDLIPSPGLRDRLITFDPNVAKGFIDEILGSLIGHSNAGPDYGQLVIWGEDALNEATWEFSQDTLQRWGWLLGREWVHRANFWRRQRQAPLLPEW